MDLVWTSGPGNVREVLSRMGRKVAYTTVMTTLKRLSEKGFLDRYMVGRGFIYSAHLTKEDWNRSLVSDLVEDLLARPPESRGLVLYCLIDAVGKYDETSLDELKAKIQQKQQELGERKLINNDTEKSRVRSA
jgi:predicted transcriptional regulator